MPWAYDLFSVKTSKNKKHAHQLDIGVFIGADIAYFLAREPSRDLTSSHKEENHYSKLKNDSPYVLSLEKTIYW